MSDKLRMEAITRTGKAANEGFGYLVGTPQGPDEPRLIQQMILRTESIPRITQVLGEGVSTTTHNKKINSLESMKQLDCY